MVNRGEEHTHAQLTLQCLCCVSLQEAGWPPVNTTVLRGQSWVSAAQGLAFLSA